MSAKPGVQEVVEKDQRNILQLKQGLVTLLSDVIDALEVTVWEGCNVLEQ